MSSNKKTTQSLKISEIDLKNLNLKFNNCQKSSVKKIPIKYLNESLIFQSPFLKITGPIKKTGHSDFCQFDTQFQGDTNRRNVQWLNFLEKMEDHIIDEITNNSSDWFQKKNLELKSLIREKNDDSGSLFVRWIINVNTQLINDKKEVFHFNDLKENDCIKLILEISDLWVSGNRFGLATIIHKGMVIQHVEKPEIEYIFNENESEESVDGYDDDILSLIATEQKPKMIQNENFQKNKNISEQLTQKNRVRFQDDEHIQSKCKFDENYNCIDVPSQKTRNTTHQKQDDIFDDHFEEKTCVKRYGQQYDKNPKRNVQSNKNQSHLYSDDLLHDDDYDWN